MQSDAGLPPQAGPGQEIPTEPAWLVAVALAGVVLVFGWMHLAQPGLGEVDGFFHARFAQLMPDFGLSRQFHWTQASTWREGFCDKEFLFHVLMLPFTRSAEPLLGARIFGFMMSCGIFVALYGALRASRVPYPALFALLPLASGPLALLRYGSIRALTLSVILLLAGMVLLQRRAWKALFILGFVYAWSYTFPLVLAMTAAAYVAGHWLGGGELDWRSVAASVLGAILGLAIHPYSPLTLEMFVTILEILRQGTQGGLASVELGVEFNSQSARDNLLLFPLMHAAWAGLLLRGCLGGARLSPQALGVLAAALFWTVMTLIYSRFSEYSVPLFALLLGCVARDLWSGLGAEERAAWIDCARFRAWPETRARVVLAVAALLLAGCFVHSMDGVRGRIAMTYSPPEFYGAARWFERNLKPGETVANAFWDDFPALYYCSPRQNYLWGIDPTFTLRFDARKAALLNALSRQGIVNAPLLAQEFGARVLVASRGRLRVIPEIREGTWRPVYADERAEIFSLQDPNAPRHPMPVSNEAAK